MQEIIALQQKIAPELIELMERRYNILRNIYSSQPIGRRALAVQLNLGERTVRSDVDFLKEQGLLITDPAGMRVTPEGESIIWHLADYIKHLRGLTELENALAKKLKIPKAIVIPGDADIDPLVKKELGRAAAKFIREYLFEGLILAVTGGSTLREFADALPQYKGKQDIMVVPARGGLGEDVEKQASTIAAKVAKKIGGSYRMLHVPENLGEEALQSLARDPKIDEIVRLIKSADILIHGIGKAEEMAGRREASMEEIQELHDKGAVGEAFGYYFDQKGRIVHTTNSLGIRLDDLDKIPTVLAVAGGKSKGAAILAVLANKPKDILITDEGAARQMLSLLGGEVEE